MALAPSPEAAAAGASSAAHEPSAVALPPLISQHLPPLGSQRQPPPAPAHPQLAPAPGPPTQLPSADPIFQAGINQITLANAPAAPAKYQANSRLLLERFFVLWVDSLAGPRAFGQADRVWEALYVVSLATVFVNRVLALPHAEREPTVGSFSGFAWLLARTLGLQAKIACWAPAAGDGALAAKWADLGAECRALNGRVLELVGRGDKRDGRGGLRVREGGDAVREAVWGQVVEATLRHAQELLPLPAPGLCEPSSVILFASVNSDLAAADGAAAPASDPFAHGADGQHGQPTGPNGAAPCASSAPHPPYAIHSQAQAHALLLTLLSFGLSLVSLSGSAIVPPDSPPVGGAAPPTDLVPAPAHFPWLAQRRVELGQLFLAAWHEIAPSAGSTASAARARTALTYVELAADVGVGQSGVWVKMLELIKGRCREALEADDDGDDDDDEAMDVDGAERGPASGSVREARAALDRALRRALEDVRVGEAERADCVNGLTDVGAVVRFLEIGPREGDLTAASISVLSLLPSSLPALRPIAALFASRSFSTPANLNGTPTKAQPATQRKRKRGEYDRWEWGRLTAGLADAAFGGGGGEGVRKGPFEGGQEAKKALVVDLKDRLKACLISSDDRDATAAFCRHLPSVVMALSGALHTDPPPLPSTAPTRAQLAALTAHLRSIPVAVGSALSTLAQDGALPTKARVTALDAVAGILGRLYVSGGEGQPLRSLEASLVKGVAKALESSERSIRMAASRVILSYFDFHEPAGPAFFTKVEPMFDALCRVLAHGSPPARETALATLGRVGTTRNDGELLRRVGEQLVGQLGESDPWLKSLAHTTILAVARHHGKTPYKFFYPHFKWIAIRLADSLLLAPSMLSDFVTLIHETEENFLATTLAYTTPHLVLHRRKDLLAALARKVRKEVPELLLENLLGVLYHVLVQDEPTAERGLAFVLRALASSMVDRNGRGEEVRAGELLRIAEPVKLLYMLIVDLGDEDPKLVERAEAALSKAEAKFKEVQQPAGPLDLGEFLKPYMLGIISNVNEVLQDVQGRKSVDDKKRVIRSLGALMRKIGDTMATFSQQIMVTLQGNLNKEPLRLVTLQTWHTFLSVLRFKDIVPHVGPSTAAFVTAWDSFSPTERALAAEIIHYCIVENAEFTGPVLDDIVDLENIPELVEAARRLRLARNKWSMVDQIRNLLRRAADENTTISIRALEELRALLLKRDQVTQLASGDAFDPVVGDLVGLLLRSAARDGDNVADLRDVSLDCLGIIGALDPDRFSIASDDTSMTIKDNLEGLEEAQAFAVHLLVHLLVGAFRATNDTRYQENLAYAIQELSRFCGFTKDLIDKSGGRNPVSVKTRERWKRIPAQKQVTVADMLDTKYVLRPVPEKTFDRPIYGTCPTYREWIQKWTSDLIPRTSDGHARTIFDIFRVVIKSSDVHIARHLLPHLVLNVLLSGDAQAREDISTEMRAVLVDQVDPQGGFPADRRLLSAQTVFDLMDHISKWIRHQRMDITKRRKDAQRAGNTNMASLDEAARKLASVDSVISSIETKLTAQAALQCRAYARSLLNFEQRIVALRHSGVSESSAESQENYEHLHQIYASLDEPDGMEGISSKVLVPSLEHQIREHESTGKWTSAQSCWEVQIQESPDDLNLHLGLLRCLRNLGHYDTLRTHIQGLVSLRPEWDVALSSFRVEGAWIVGDWQAVEDILAGAGAGAVSPEVAIAKVLVEIRSGGDRLPAALRAARLELGRPLNAAGRHSYQRSYDSVVRLHVLHELELIATSSLPALANVAAGPNEKVLARERVVKMKSALDNRLGRILPSFRAQEPILSMRRTAFDLCTQSQVEGVDGKEEIGQAWLLSSKIARKAGHSQTAYSAVLQARQYSTPFTFVQDAKLLYSTGQNLRALQELQNSLNPILGDGTLVKGDLAKAALLKGRWTRDTERFDMNEVIQGFKLAISLDQEWESPYYHLGHYYDSAAGESIYSMTAAHKTVENYARALRYGTKYIYRTMPRMLTIWMDCGERADLVKLDDAKDPKTPAAGDAKILQAMTNIVHRSLEKLPHYQWLTAFPQVVSRIGHANLSVYKVLARIITAVIRTYPLQSIWSMVSVSQSKKEERLVRCQAIFAKLGVIEESEVGSLSVFINKALAMTKELLRLAKFDVPKNSSTFSMQRHFPALKTLAPSPLLVPLQEALTVSLPSNGALRKQEHNPFPICTVLFKGFYDEVDVMSSLVRPKKITVLGDDGNAYSFLCKPNDDLRKDARLMDFNAMINKLLKKDSDSRRRNLYIRTYAVTPLNDECGLCQWVNNTIPLRNILQKTYSSKGIQIYGPDVVETYRKWPAMSDPDVASDFSKRLLPSFPPVFHEWFLETFPEPSAWLSARLSYARTYAVMSMVGFVLGLGDRHGENTLYDANSGDAVHVDLNCLFEKGRTFEVKERVPFRLTQNQVDGFGITGVEGVYRNACEVTMRILRENKDSLMSVLEAFIHDPLVEWENDKRKLDNQRRSKSRTKGQEAEDTSINALARKALVPIERKLRGVQAGYVSPTQAAPTKEITVSNQVEALIQEATNPVNLARMYIGWGAYL